MGLIINNGGKLSKLIYEVIERSIICTWTLCLRKMNMRECCSLWLVNIMEPKIQDMVMHTSTMKEMWNYLELYSDKNNLNRALDVIREMFQREQ